MPPHDLHDPMIQRHVADLAGLQAWREAARERLKAHEEEVESLRLAHAADMEKITVRVGLVEQDMVVLKVKFATYSAIAVFLANIAFKLIFG